MKKLLILLEREYMELTKGGLFEEYLKPVQQRGFENEM